MTVAANRSALTFLLDNFAGPPGAFKTMRVMKVLNSGTAELGIAGLPPAPDSARAACLGLPALGAFGSGPGEQDGSGTLGA